MPDENNQNPAQNSADGGDTSSATPEAGATIYSHRSERLKAALTSSDEATPHLSLAKSDYKAFDTLTGRSVFMLDFRFTGASYLMSYAHLGAAHIQYGHKGDTVTLYTLRGRVTLEGHNLLELRDRLQEHDVRYVQEFDPLRHEQPEDGAALVLKIDMPDEKKAT